MSKNLFHAFRFIGVGMIGFTEDKVGKMVLTMVLRSCTIAVKYHVLERRRVDKVMVSIWVADRPGVGNRIIRGSLSFLSIFFKGVYD